MSAYQMVEYGQTTDVFVSRKSRGETLIVGGTGARNPWSRVLSRRCAHLLWIQLTQILFPEKVRIVMAMAATTPLRAPEAPTVTSDVTITVKPDGLIEIAGTSGTRHWGASLDVDAARQLWIALDLALYPVGWEGSRVVRRQ